MMVCNTILDAMGNTPIIRLQHMTGPDDAEILVKFEGLNIGGYQNKNCSEYDYRSGKTGTYRT